MVDGDDTGPSTQMTNQPQAITAMNALHDGLLGTEYVPAIYGD